MNKMANYLIDWAFCSDDFISYKIVSIPYCTIFHIFRAISQYYTYTYGISLIFKIFHKVKVLYLYIYIFCIYGIT